MPLYSLSAAQLYFELRINYCNISNHMPAIRNCALSPGLRHHVHFARNASTNCASPVKGLGRRAVLFLLPAPTQGSVLCQGALRWTDTGSNSLSSVSRFPVYNQLWINASFTVTAAVSEGITHLSYCGHYHSKQSRHGGGGQALMSDKAAAIQKASYTTL